MRVLVDIGAYRVALRPGTSADKVAEMFEGAVVLKMNYHNSQRPYTVDRKAAVEFLIVPDSQIGEPEPEPETKTPAEVPLAAEETI